MKKLLIILLGIVSIAHAEDWFYVNPPVKLTNYYKIYTNMYNGATNFAPKTYYIETDLRVTGVVTEVQTTPMKPFSDVRYALNALVGTNASGGMSAYVATPNNAVYALNGATMTNAEGAYRLAVNLDGMQAIKLDRDGDTAGSLTVTNLTTVNSINDFENSNFKAGNYAGYYASGNNNSYLGNNAGSSASGDDNSYLGPHAGSSASGDNNSYLGPYAGNAASGDNNFYSGYTAGEHAVGFYNSYIGRSAGRNSISTNSLYLGSYAGQEQINENKAYFGNFTTIDINTAKVVNITAGTDAMDAVIVNQLTGATNAIPLSDYLPLAGGTMTGDLVMNNAVISTPPSVMNKTLDLVFTTGASTFAASGDLLLKTGASGYAGEIKIQSGGDIVLQGGSESAGGDIVLAGGAGMMGGGNVTITATDHIMGGPDGNITLNTGSGKVIIHNVIDPTSDDMAVSRGYLESGMAKSIKTVTANYTIAVGDYTVLCDGTYTMTLPTAASAINKIFIIKNIGLGTTYIDGNGSETIDGLTIQNISVQNNSLQIQSDGTEWWILLSF